MLHKHKISLYYIGEGIDLMTQAIQSFERGAIANGSRQFQDAMAILSQVPFYENISQDVYQRLAILRGRPGAADYGRDCFFTSGKPRCITFS